MIIGELVFWHDVALNLLTDSQLDTRMPNSGLTPRSVLSRGRRDEQVRLDFGRLGAGCCPYCTYDDKLDPHFTKVYCTIHQPIKVRE